MVLISCVIACPVAGLFMHSWLNIFVYNTGLTFMPFLLSVLTVLLVTLMTVTFHTLRAAVANPSESLRTE
jgi:putative ABC transport system permease protein